MDNNQIAETTRNKFVEVSDQVELHCQNKYPKWQIYGMVKMFIIDSKTLTQEQKSEASELMHNALSALNAEEQRHYSLGYFTTTLSVLTNGLFKEYNHVLNAYNDNYERLAMLFDYISRSSDTVEEVVTIFGRSYSVLENREYSDVIVDLDDELFYALIEQDDDISSRVEDLIEKVEL